jgi:phosphoribosylformimino-5-aminoimidazole carboxamide ribotide isomerase
MRLIPVLDIAGGIAVHARGGDRRQYAPVRSVLTSEAANPVHLAAAYRHALGTSELYIADLDAIEGAPTSQVARELCRSESRIWLDAGVSDPEGARLVAGLGADCVVIGLETLAWRESLEQIVRSLPSNAVAFSLDLREGAPIVGAESDIPRDIDGLLEWVGSLGVGRLIMLDLARVGSGEGVDLELLQLVRTRVPMAELVAGGGVRDGRDLDALAAAGCDAALVATALHEGRVSGAEVHAGGEWGHG